MTKEEPKFSYLVILAHTMDDVPVFMSGCRDSAFQVAEEIAWDVTGTPLAKVLDLPDMNTPVCTIVITFRDGVPCSRVVVRNFDDDEGDDSEEVVGPSPDQLVA